MNYIASILSKYKTLGLNEVEKVKLFDRIEVKFIFNLNELPSILEELSEEYSVLSIQGSGLRGYENHYFDTSDLKMYLDHHNGKLNRYKIRFRNYVDTANSFLEIKFKSNRGRTLKKRIEVPNATYLIEGKSADFLKTETGYDPSMLIESLKVDYKRITLIKLSTSERITIDTDLIYSYGDHIMQFPNIVIAEVKQPKTASSKFTALMHQKHIQPFSFSKYCLGIATVYPGVKANNFKTKIRYVNKYSR